MTVGNIKMLSRDPDNQWKAENSGLYFKKKKERKGFISKYPEASQTRTVLCIHDRESKRV